MPSCSSAGWLPVGVEELEVMGFQDAEFSHLFLWAGLEKMMWQNRWSQFNTDRPHLWHTQYDEIITESCCTKSPISFLLQAASSQKPQLNQHSVLTGYLLPQAPPPLRWLVLVAGGWGEVRRGRRNEILYIGGTTRPDMAAGSKTERERQQSEQGHCDWCFLSSASCWWPTDL